MKATRGIRSPHVPALLAAMVGLALSASGCIIDASSGGPSCGPNPAGCYPDLAIFWDIKSQTAAGSPLLSCDQAGGADTLVALIDGGCLGSNLVSFTSPCPAGVTGGSFVAPLPNAATYNVSLELHAGGAGGPLLSTTDVVPFTVDCSGLSATPTADLFVNFP